MLIAQGEIITQLLTLSPLLSITNAEVINAQLGQTCLKYSLRHSARDRAVTTFVPCRLNNEHVLIFPPVVT